MTNLAYYTSNGRIRKMFLFDKISYSGASAADIQETIGKCYRDFLNQLNAGRDAEISVWIFYSTTSFVKDIPDFTEGHARFIWVKDDDLYTSWTQDYFHVVKDPSEPTGIRLLCDRNISSNIIKYVEEFFLRGRPVEILDFEKKLPAGGDFALFKSLLAEYGIDGATINGPETKEAPALLNVNNYIRLTWNNLSSQATDIISAKLFHLDLYMTFVGPDMTSGKNIVLRAKILNEPGSVEFEQIEKGIKTFSQQLTLSGFEEEIMYLDVPLIRLGKDVILAYNNCLVENYELENKRHIRIYFPDFRKKARETIQKAWADYSSAMEEIKHMLLPINEVQAMISWVELIADIRRALAARSTEKTVVPIDFFETIYSNLGDYTEMKAYAEMEEVIADSEKEIRNCLEPLEITVDFLTLDFRYDAERQGALHCRVKVIERDCLP